MFSCEICKILKNTLFFTEHLQKPLTSSDQHPICTVHSYLNVLSWFLKELYRCNQSSECWIEKWTIINEHIQIGKKKMFQQYYWKKKSFFLTKCLGQMINVVPQMMGIRQGDFSAMILLMPLSLVCQ